MSRSFMPNAHQAAEPQRACPWSWTLAPGEARTLPAQPFASWLRVDGGEVWLTQVQGHEPASDIWLSAGESLALPEGSSWVLQAWPQARMSLLVASPGTSARGRLLTAVVASWRAFWQVISPARVLAS